MLHARAILSPLIIPTLKSNAQPAAEQTQRHLTTNREGFLIIGKQTSHKPLRWRNIVEYVFPKLFSKPLMIVFHTGLVVHERRPMWSNVDAFFVCKSHSEFLQCQSKTPKSSFIFAQQMYRESASCCAVFMQGCSQKTWGQPLSSTHLISLDSQTSTFYLTCALLRARACAAALTPADVWTDAHAPRSASSPGGRFWRAAAAHRPRRTPSPGSRASAFSSSRTDG